jgi:hypothetical protein
VSTNQLPSRVSQFDSRRAALNRMIPSRVG